MEDIKLKHIIGLIKSYQKYKLKSKNTREEFCPSFLDTQRYLEFYVKEIYTDSYDYLVIEISEEI